MLLTAQHSLIDPLLGDLADREVLALAEWLRERCEVIDRGERVVTWLKLKRILARFNVTWSHPNRGNRIDLYRTVERRRGLLRRRTVVGHLHIQVAYRSDGSDVPRNTIKDLRRALELDERCGCDSKAFYEASDVPGDFIVEYQQLLRRLAKL